MLSVSDGSVNFDSKLNLADFYPRFGFEVLFDLLKDKNFFFWLKDFLFTFDELKSCTFDIANSV